MRVADHRVAVDLGERHLAGEVDAEQDHARDPEEEDVPAGLEDRGRVEHVEVARLRGPAHDRPRPEAGREPGVEHILVLLERELGVARELLRVRGRLFERAADHPVLALVALHVLDERKHNR